MVTAVGVLSVPSSVTVNASAEGVEAANVSPMPSVTVVPAPSTDTLDVEGAVSTVTLPVPFVTGVPALPALSLKAML